MNRRHTAGIYLFVCSSHVLRACGNTACFAQPTLTGSGQAASTGSGQAYPAKPIRIIIPFPIGGIADVFARIVGSKMNEAWGQPVVIENRAGAGGNIGADFVAKAPPDGYTLVIGSIGTHAVNVSLFRKLPYDPVRDFAPISMLLEAEGLLVLHPSVPVRNVKELIALAKSRPGQIIYASAGNGTAGHLSGELLKSMAKVDLVHVPYKGNVPAITDLIGGQTSLLFATMPTVLPHGKKWPPECHRGHRRQTFARCTRAAGDCGNAAGLRRDQLGRRICAGRHAARCGEQAAYGVRACDAGAGYSEAPSHGRCKIHAVVAGAIRRFCEIRDRQVGEGDSAVGHPCRLVRYVTICFY